MTNDNIATVSDWLINGARSAQQPHQVLAELCDRLVRCGIPLRRAAVVVRTLHPQVMGRRFAWRLGADVAVSEFSFDSIDTAEFKGSPESRVYESGAAVRLRLDPPDGTLDFRVLRDLQSDGATDFLATPLIFSNGELHVATWATQQAGGFTEAQIEDLETIVAPLSRLAEIYALRRTAVNLLDTYVGHATGERILSGQIRRGDTETIHAAIWLSDMRGFTPLADRLPPQDLVALLNRYFDCQIPAITRRGGEVLKFIGDGLLAVFPVVGSSGSAKIVCNNALAAAYEARAQVAAIRQSTDLPSGDPVRFGVALHVGDVLYGNVGGKNRLDFTCIGPAVNLAARLEDLAGKLERVILASAEFAEQCDGEWMPLGEFALPGFANPEMVFGVRDETKQQEP